MHRPRSRLRSAAALAVALSTLLIAHPSRAELRLLFVRDISMEVTVAPLQSGDHSPSLTYAPSGASSLAWVRGVLNTAMPLRGPTVMFVPLSGAMAALGPVLQEVAPIGEVQDVAVSQDTMRSLVFYATRMPVSGVATVRLWLPGATTRVPDLHMTTDALVALTAPMVSQPAHVDFGIVTLDPARNSGVILIDAAMAADYSSTMMSGSSIVAYGTIARLARPFSGLLTTRAVAIPSPPSVTFTTRPGTITINYPVFAASALAFTAVRPDGMFAAVPGVLPGQILMARSDGLVVRPADPALIALPRAFTELAAAPDFGAPSAWVVAYMPGSEQVAVISHGTPDPPLVVDLGAPRYSMCRHLTTAPMPAISDVMAFAIECRDSASMSNHILLAGIQRVPTVRPDAGPDGSTDARPMDDAGSPDVGMPDSGAADALADDAPIDDATAPDGGPAVHVRGGACRCRAGATDRAGGLWAFGFVAALTSMRRRRARALG